MNCFFKYLFIATLIFGSVAMLCGGTTNAEVDDKVREIVSQVRGEVEQRADESFSIFEPIEVMRQVVAGLNYFVKVDVGGGRAVFARIYDHFGEISLSDIQTNKSIDDPLEYF